MDDTCWKVKCKADAQAWRAGGETSLCWNLDGAFTNLPYIRFNEPSVCVFFLLCAFRIRSSAEALIIIFKKCNDF